MKSVKLPELNLGWGQRMEACGATLLSAEPVLQLTKKDGSFLFTFAKIKAKDPENTPILPYLLLRGSAVVIVTEITCASTGKKFLLMVRQWRSGSVEFTYEFPAGMVEAEPTELNLKNCVVREMKEETGLDINATDLFSLSKKPLYPAPSLCDEGLYYFGIHLNLSPEAREQISGASYGKSEEGEKTHVRFFPLPLNIADFSTLATVAGYHMYLQNQN